MRFTLRQLQSFEAVARTCHFGRAAEALGLSQPTISGDVKRLEQALRVTLFDRSRAGTVLTEAGTQLFPLAVDVLEAAERFGQGATRVAGAPETVRMAATPSLINRLVPATLEVFSAHPGQGVAVNVVEVPTGGVPQALSTAAADIGVGHFLKPVQGARLGAIGTDELFVLTAVDRLRISAPTRLADLGIGKLLTWPRKQNPDYFDFIVDACRQRGLDPEIVETTSHLSGPYSYMLTSGEAFAIVPADYARETSHRMSYAPLDPPAMIPLQALWKVPASDGIGRVLKVLRELRRSTHAK